MVERGKQRPSEPRDGARDDVASAGWGFVGAANGDRMRAMNPDIEPW